jgi:hypothetical protein
MNSLGNTADGIGHFGQPIENASLKTFLRVRPLSNQRRTLLGGANLID